MQCVEQNPLEEVSVLNNNVKYRIKFSKTGNLIFIGHLDFLKFFQRTIKRAGLPIAYSLGFNPHQLITFAIPLPLGTSSIGEYVDIQLKTDMECDVIKEKLNSTMPLGIEILSVRKIKEGEKTCAASVEAGLYNIILPEVYDNIEKAVCKIIDSSEINVERTVKKKTKITNIRPLIYSISIKENIINTLIATGSQSNLKPEILVSEIFKVMEKEYVPYKIDIERLELYKSEKGEFVPL